MTKKTSQGKQNSVPTLVLYGMDEGEKPRAASFGASQSEAAFKLADKMNFGVLKITTPEQTAVAAQLPAGQLYVSGKGFVPYVGQELYAKVFALVSAAGPAPTGEPAEGAATSASAEQSVPANQAEGSSDATLGNGQASQETRPGPGPAQSTITGYPSSWTEIEVGHLVVAQESLEDGWW